MCGAFSCLLIGYNWVGQRVCPPDPCQLTENELMSKHRPLPPLSELEERLSYEPETGFFRWKVKAAQRVQIGDIAGSIGKARVKGTYVEVRHNGILYACHRLAWLFYCKEDPLGLQIDHVNTIRYDNWISNLRLATRSQNTMNTGLRSDNTSGAKSVYWQPETNRWFALVTLNSERRWLGYFDLREEAVAAATVAREEMHGEFTRHS